MYALVKLAIPYEHNLTACFRVQPLGKHFPACIEHPSRIHEEYFVGHFRLLVFGNVSTDFSETKDVLGIP